jgi:hypothetical protein
LSRRGEEKPDPFDENTISYDIPMMGYQMVDQMLDDTATEFDVYAQFMKMAANAPEDDANLQVTLTEAALIALQNMNSANDD